MHKTLGWADICAHTAGHTLGRINIKNRNPEFLLLAACCLATGRKIFGHYLDSLNVNAVYRTYPGALSASNAVINGIVKAVATANRRRNRFSWILKRDESVNLMEIIDIINTRITLSVKGIEEMLQRYSHASGYGGGAGCNIFEILAHSFIQRLLDSQNSPLRGHRFPISPSERN